MVLKHWETQGRECTLVKLLERREAIGHGRDLFCRVCTIPIVCRLLSGSARERGSRDVSEVVVFNTETPAATYE